MGFGGGGGIEWVVGAGGRIELAIGDVGVCSGAMGHWCVRAWVCGG